MPFTISHAAAILPFSRPLARGRLLSAATVGAMVPDFRVFLPWHLQRMETHSAPSLFTFCLPVGLLTYWLFQRVIKTPLLAVQSDAVYARWQIFAQPASLASLRQWLLASAGVLIGALTHLVWDAFTHEGARGVRMLPMLGEPFFDIGRHHLLGIRLLQDGSSLLGLLAVMVVLAYGLRGGKPGVIQRDLAAGERHAWAAAYLLAVLLSSAVCFVWARGGDIRLHSLPAMANDLAVASLRGLAIALLLISLALHARLHAVRYRSSTPAGP